MIPRKYQFHRGFLITGFVCMSLLVMNIYRGERRIEQASDSLSGIYNDRLVAERYIFTLNDLLHTKKQLYSDGAGSPEKQAALNSSWNGTFREYTRTKLSTIEHATTELLKRKINEIVALENENIGSADAARIPGLIDEARQMLLALSDIQVAEGTKLNTEGQSYLSSSLVGVKLQFALFAILLLCVVGFLRNLTLPARVPQQHELN